jgi:hypothetical protein
MRTEALPSFEKLEAMDLQNSELLRDLKREEERRSQGEALLQEAEELLQQGVMDDERILERIRNAAVRNGPSIDPSGLDQERIFSEAAIRKLCIKYRLRFLSASLFKDELPHEAISELKDLEAQVGQKIEDLRIVAPGERFRLQDSQKDPLLLAHLGNGQFYLVHRWGQDLSTWRKLLHYPFRDLRTLLITSAVLSLLISIFIPAQLFQAGPSATTELIVLFRAMSFFLLSSFFMTATLIFGVTTAKEFSSDQWNSKFFN